jgi:hypothetical protein
MNELSTLLFGIWQLTDARAMLAPLKGTPVPADSELGVVWTMGRQPLTSRLFNPVLVDACSGALVLVVRMPWRALEVS